MSLVKVTSIQRDGKAFANDLLVDLTRITEPVFENIGGNAVIILNETPSFQDSVNRGNNNIQYVLSESLAEFIILSSINVFQGTVVSRDGRTPVVSQPVFFIDKIIGRILQDPLGSRFFYEEQGGFVPVEYIVSQTVAQISAALIDADSSTLPYKVYSALLTETAPATIVAGPLIMGETYTITDYMGGIVDTISLVDAGTGYTTALGVPVLGGSGTGMTVDVTETGGVIDTVVINNPGEGYTALDLISVAAGDGLGTFVVDNVLSDDFTNVGASLNQDAEVFVATGTTPTDYSNASTLDSAGNPVATINENTLGTIVFSYNAAGDFTCTGTGLFTLGATHLLIGNVFASDSYANIDGSSLTVNKFDFFSYISATNVKTDGLFLNTPIEIKVYI